MGVENRPPGTCKLVLACQNTLMKILILREMSFLLAPLALVLSINSLISRLVTVYVIGIMAFCLYAFLWRLAVYVSGTYREGQLILGMSISIIIFLVSFWFVLSSGRTRK